MRTQRWVEILRGVPHVNGVTIAVPATGAAEGKTDRLQRLGGSMSLENRLESLKERHAALEARIFEEDQRPRPDYDMLTRLKVEKLHVKDEMERLRNQQH